MPNPLISVLMPVYNSESFLREAIDSVLVQSFKEFELLIIDDGSTDASVHIVQTFSDPRIRFHQNEKNEGISYTLNKGIDLARCELIARMDADDICYPERLEKQYQFILDHPDGALYTCAAVEVAADRKFLRQDNFKPEHFYYNMTFGVWMYHPTMVYRKEAVEAIGKYTVRYAEDWELAWQLSRRYKMYHQVEALLEYRTSPTSLSNMTHKNEYAQAMAEQGLRNIRYFLGENTNVSAWSLRCFLNTGEAVAEKFAVRQAAEALTVLDRVTKKTLTTPNVNRDPVHIKEAAQEKKDAMLKVLFSRLTFFKGISLLLLTGNVKALQPLVLRRITSRFRFQKKRIKSLVLSE